MHMLKESMPEANIDADDTVISRSTNDARNRFTKLKQDMEPRKSADIYCDACRMHGHIWKKCDLAY
jgi:hypothetical protein